MLTHLAGGPEIIGSDLLLGGALSYIQITTMEDRTMGRYSTMVAKQMKQLRRMLKYL